MEKHKTVCFFGHRNVVRTEELQKRVERVVEDLIERCGVDTFLFGSRSKFDELCHFVVTKLKGKYPQIKRIAYTCKSETCVLESEREKLEKTYAIFQKTAVSLLGVEEEFEHKTKYTSGKASYVERNRAMIDDSKYCVFYYDEKYQPVSKKNTNSPPKSGTALAYEYAKGKKKEIFNVCP